ncbi:MAG TPA: hypothetical protein VGH19_05125 [Verrucomicrobiae bacterium]
MSKPVHHHKIRLHLKELSQLFNSMDPSPFQEKDLDQDAEEFILSWAQEFPSKEPIELVIHLDKAPEMPEATKHTMDSIHHYFAYRAKLNWMEFKRLMKTGRISLIIGLLFLGVCLMIVEVLAQYETGPALTFIRESLMIAGWVAMWRPMEIYLYEWWPIRRKGKVFEKLAHMPVHIVVGKGTEGEVKPGIQGSMTAA